MAHRRHPNDDQRPAKPKSSGIIHKWKASKQSEGNATADWGYCDGATLAALVSVVAGQGGAVLLGYSRDQGAYRIILMDGDDKHTEWVPCTADITEAILGITESIR